MVAPLISRRRDLAYLIFFATHIPIMFLVDLHPLYPAALRPAMLDDIRAWYVAQYRDQLFTHPPAWFGAYLWLELLYHVPLSVWAVGALARGDARAPLHLLVWAVEAGVTTLTCVAEALAWEGVPAGDKAALGALYGTYLALSVFMGVDMFARLSGTLQERGERKKTA